MAYPSPAIPGVPILFLPDIIIADGEEFGLAPNHAPLPADEWHEFPFPRLFNEPFRFPEFPLPTELACKRLQAAEITTQAKSKTTTARQVEDLPEAQQIHVVRRCTTLWDNLVSYCYPQGPGVHTVAPPNVQNHTPTTYTRSSATAQRFPDARQQAEALDSMFGWFIAHNGRLPAAMTSEPAVQDEVHAQLIEPLNIMLRTRYRTFGTHIEDEDEDAPFYPQWGRSCPAAHANPTSNKKNAGFPDYILYISPRRRHHAAVMEVKTWWSYLDDDVESIFTPAIVASISGRFNWRNKLLGSVLLKQLWGEMHFFRVKWAAWTNGRKIFICVQSAPNELTLSEIHDFHGDTSVHQALLGMNLAGIDETTGSIPYVIDSVCPPHERESLW